jgi:RNA polymerase sigma factor (sigma-70 family)
MSITSSSRPHQHALREPAAGRRAPDEDPALISLVCAARAGDEAAWTALVRRFDRRLRGMARSYRLAPADVDDVVQATWLSLLENFDALRNPAAIAAWLATALGRKAMRVLQQPMREQLSDDPRLGNRAIAEGPEAILLAAERRDVLAAALAALPERPRRLMTLLRYEPDVDYGQISRLLSMPVGSIGPTRARSLARLSRDQQLLAVHDGSATSGH